MELSWDGIVAADQQLFLLLNGWHTPVTDFLFYWITYKYTWIPLYIWMLYDFIRTDRKRGIVVFLLVVTAVIVADYITSGLMKPYFARFRPCNDPVIGHLVHNTAGCGGKYGFASSHASTAFALATATFLFVGKRLQWTKWLFVWAAVYAYSRVAVGVHYPLDIVVGALVGVLAGAVIVVISDKIGWRVL